MPKEINSIAKNLGVLLPFGWVLVHFDLWSRQVTYSLLRGVPHIFDAYRSLHFPPVSPTYFGRLSYAGLMSVVPTRAAYYVVPLTYAVFRPDG